MRVTTKIFRYLFLMLMLLRRSGHGLRLSTGSTIARNLFPSESARSRLPRSAAITSFSTPGHQMLSRKYSIRSCALALSTRAAQQLEESAATRKPRNEAQLMQDVLWRVRDVNRKTPPSVNTLAFHVDGRPMGKVVESTARELVARGGGVFALEAAPPAGDDGVVRGSSWQELCLTLTDQAGSTFDTRTDAVARVMQSLRSQGVVRGWRDELYPVTTSFYEPPALAVERAAAPLLGAIEYGVHVNGLVAVAGAPRIPSCAVPQKMWIARRSAQKSKYPGMLDHIVAGGQPHGMSLLENVVKECEEEAGIPETMARSGIRPASAISYETYSSGSSSTSSLSLPTITRAVLFNYDLYLPPDFVPKPVDGEVQEFFLWTMDEVLDSMSVNYHDPIKPNCYSVIIDFLLRHGHLSPDIPGYLDVLRELRSGDCR